MVPMEYSAWQDTLVHTERILIDTDTRSPCAVCRVPCADVTKGVNAPEIIR